MIVLCCLRSTSFGNCKIQSQRRSGGKYHRKGKVICKMPSSSHFPFEGWEMTFLSSVFLLHFSHPIGPTYHSIILIRGENGRIFLISYSKLYLPGFGVGYRHAAYGYKFKVLGIRTRDGYSYESEMGK